MASVQVPVKNGFHVTLVHFDKLTDEDADVVEIMLGDLSEMIKTKPTGVYGIRIQVGPRRNIPAIRVQSQWIEDVRSWLVHKFGEYGILFSNNYNAFTPHVTRPTISMAPTTLVGFEPWIELHNKSGKTPFVGFEVG